MRRVTGVVQHYAWGDPEAIPTLLGLRPDGRPWAEWWLGTHPGGPATVVGDGPLAEVAGELPYLLKVLAAASPLSMQTHPSPAQATAGFAREQAAGIAADAPERIYRDAAGKPELLCALTRFDALCGFRPAGETEALLHDLGAHDLAGVLRQDGLAALVEQLYRRRLDLGAAVAVCATSRRAEAELVSRLWRDHPGDPSVLVTLLLNRVTLRPGEAVYLGPGNLHAYLHGLAVEVMGGSDNVVRGGLTTKHVDVDELLRVVDITPLSNPVVHAVEVAPGCWCYPTPGAPFDLTRFDVIGSLPHTAKSREVLCCVAGETGPLHQGEAGYLAPGEAVVLHGPSTVFCAAAANDEEES
jgi:mannose-6-phosphate isomerase